MIVVMPDARDSGSADIEQAVFGNRAELRLYQATNLDDVPSEAWQTAEALMIWGRLRCDKAMLDRAPNVRMIIRMGVGFDALRLGRAQTHVLRTVEPDTISATVVECGCRACHATSQMYV